MHTFLPVAALMAAIAAAAVAWPLLRDRGSRVQGVVAAVLVIGAAAGLYPLWSTWDWQAPSQPQAASPDVIAMVTKLEKRLQEEPNDLAGWLLLGRSFVALERLDDAVLAYDHARRLDGSSVEALLGLAEALSLQAGGQITPQASQLFEQALTLAPHHPKALLYGGVSPATRGDRTAARARWQELKDLHPPPQIEQMLDARLAELGPPDAPAGEPAAAGGPVGATNGSPEGTNASAGGTSTVSGDSAAAQVTVNISIAPTLKSRLSSETPLFIFAREPGSHGPPLAATRLTSSAIGRPVQLSAADSMLPGHVLTGGQRVSVTARVSFSGQPVPVSGDLYGELSYDVGRDGARDLVIDRIAQ